MRISLILCLVTFLSVTEGYVITCYAPMNSPGPSKMEPLVDRKICTHILVIGGTFVNSDGLLLLPPPDKIRSFVNLKNRDEKVKILLTLTPRNHFMSRIVLDDGLMRQMASTLVHYMIDNELDGFDIDWEFPVWSPDAKKTDKKGFATLLQALRTRFDQEKKPLILMVTAGAPYTIAKVGYDIGAINRYADYLQIMTYDFHDVSRLEPITGFNAPLRAANYEFLILAKMNSDYSLRYWLQMGLQRNKTVFGIPTYGKGFTLLTKYLHFPYAPAVGPSKFGGTVDFPTICNLTSNGYTYHWSSRAATPYFVKNHQWITSEDVNSVRVKASYAKSMNLAGVMIFGLHADDYDGICEQGRYPLTSSIHDQMVNKHG